MRNVVKRKELTARTLYMKGERTFEETATSNLRVRLVWYSPTHNAGVRMYLVIYLAHHSALKGPTAA